MTDEMHQAISDVLGQHGLDLYDLELSGTVVRVTVDRAGGVDLDALAEATRAVSSALDTVDPIPGRYTLEVSSPGLERRLRTPGHFAGAKGESVSVRVRRADGEVERLVGQLVEADDEGIVVNGPQVPGDSARVSYGEIDRARTVFEWKARSAPSPSRGKPSPGQGPAGKGAGGKGAAGKRATSKERVRTP